MVIPFQNTLDSKYISVKILLFNMDLDLGRRKVQRMGKSGAYFVTLPIPWLKTCKILKGCAVNVSMGADGVLRIHPPEAV